MGKYTGILLVSDWDRTVTGPDGSIPPANTEAVLRFIAGGGRVSIATGHTRLSHASRWARLPTNAPAIVFNGAEIYDYHAQKSVWQGPLPASAPGLLQGLLARWPQLHFEIQRPDETYVFGGDMGLAEIMRKMGVPIREAPMEDVPWPWIQLAVSGTPKAPAASRDFDWFRDSEPEADALFTEVLRAIAADSGFSASRSLPFLIEAQAAGCSKGETARRLLALLGCETLVCCGDAPNDLSLLRAADRAFVAGDGDEAMLGMGFPRTVPSGEGVLADVISRL